MSIVVNAPAPVPAGVFLGARVPRGPGKAQARLNEVTEALKGLTPIDDEGVGPSITVEGKYAKVLTKAAKSLGIKLKIRAVEGQPTARQAWVK